LILRKRVRPTLILPLIGCILIMINGAWIAINGKAIVVSAFKATSVEQITASKQFWGRIAFGTPGIIGGMWTPLWLVFALIMAACIFTIYRKPRRETTIGGLIAALSILSIPIGGGFYIGAIFAFCGGIAGLKRNKPFKETSVGRLIRAATLDSKLYAMLRETPDAIQTAGLTVLLVGFLSGIGNGLYVHNVSLIKKGGTPSQAILLEGYMFWHDTVIMVTLAIIGLAVIRWLLLSTTIYGVGAKLTGASSDYDKVARAVAFAFVPESLLVILPLMLSNEPTLSFNWPIGLYILVQIWVFLGVIVGISKAFDFQKKKAAGITILGGTIYWLIYELFIVPTLKVPGFRIDIAMPESALAILVVVGIATLLAAVLGAFSKR